MDVCPRLRIQRLIAACAGVSALCLSASAETVSGKVHFLEESQGGSAKHQGFWRVPNGVLPIAPPPSSHDVRSEVLVLLTPQGTVTGAQVAAAEEAAKSGAQKLDLRIFGLHITPTASLVAPGTTVTLVNEDKVTHRVLAVGLTSILPKESLPPSEKLSFTVTTEKDKVSSIVLRSPAYPHLVATLYSSERSFGGKVEPSGSFSFDAPAGHYQALLLFRGHTLTTQTLDVNPKEGATLDFVGPFSLSTLSRVAQKASVSAKK